VLRSVHLSEKVARSGLLDRSFDAGQCAGVLPMQVLYAVPFAIGRRLKGMAGLRAIRPLGAAELGPAQSDLP
jgi:hypothetical protein